MPFEDRPTSCKVNGINEKIEIALMPRCRIARVRRQCKALHIRVTYSARAKCAIQAD